MAYTPIKNKEELKKLKRMLAPESYRWFQLGIQLRIPIEHLKKIEKEGGRKPPDRCFSEVIDDILRADPPKKWKDIFTALEDVHKRRLMRELKEKYHDGDNVWDDVGGNAKELINMLEDVIPDWYMFGQSLDIPTRKLKAFRDEKGMDMYLSQMMDHLYDEMMSYATIENVIEALENIGNKRLAQQVKEEFLIYEQSKLLLVSLLSGLYCLLGEISR
jgi:hypothetical protein